MRVLLRCDASAGSGVGHLVRCLALAEEVAARGGTPVLAGTFDAPLARRLVAAAGIEVLEPGPASDLLAWATARGADVLHVDDYAIGPVGRSPHVVTSSIEDGTFGRRTADVVVDSTLGAEAADRPADGSGEVLLGIAFAPLRAAVRRARDLATSREPADPPTVLVVLGGTDPAGATAPATRLAVRAGAGRVLVAGSGGAVVDGRVEHLGPQDDLPLLAARCDVVVSAAGTSVWELACVGAPPALVQVTENQSVGYRRALDAGLAVGLGTVADLDGPAAEERLRALLGDRALRSALSSTGRATVDGLGAGRVVDAWERALRSRVRARRAVADDAAMLLDWRNDPATRAMSRTNDPVAPDDHRRWLDSVLADDDRTLLVALLGDEHVGTVRFDRVDPGLWEVSITMAPGARGRGLARAVLGAAEQAWRRDVGPEPAVLACVRPDNPASARVFVGAGYVRRPGARPDGLDAYVLEGAVRPGPT